MLPFEEKMMTKSVNINGASADLRTAKLPYTTPELMLHGQVSALTGGASTCGDNDSAACTVGAGNMGEKPPKP